MSFTSVSFLFGFLPALLAVYYFIPERLRSLRNLLLLGASLFFYAWAGPKLLPVLLTSIALNYLFGLLVCRSRNWPRRAVLALAILCNLGLLGWFKYAGFLANSLNSLGLSLTAPKLALPLGISFFTFQALSYVVDVYRGNVTAEKNPLRVALYLSFFPRLGAGPIARYTPMAEDLRERQETADCFVEGAVRFLLGMAKKLLLANSLALVADGMYNTHQNELSTAMAWLGTVSYTLQIYLDFSAYSDMAIGLGKMFGFRIPENFNYPYVAKSVTEFWRRWHMTLSSWFRDYLYIPLGGNRCGLARQIFNLLVVWCATGLWHGAAWNFVAWGIFYAVLLIGERYFWGKGLEKLPVVLRLLCTLFAVNLGWVLFRSTDLVQAVNVLRVMLGFGEASGWSNQALYYLLEYRWELIIGVIACLPVKNWLSKYLESHSTKWSGSLLLWGPRLLALFLGGFALARMVSSGFNPFIYANF